MPVFTAKISDAEWWELQDLKNKSKSKGNYGFLMYLKNLAKNALEEERIVPFRLGIKKIGGKK